MIKKGIETSRQLCGLKHLCDGIKQGSHRSGKSGNSGEILKSFSSQGNQGKTGVFQPKSGKKFQIRELFFQTISKPFKPINLRKCFLRLLNLRSCQEIAVFA